MEVVVNSWMDGLRNGVPPVLGGFIYPINKVTPHAMVRDVFALVFNHHDHAILCCFILFLFFLQFCAAGQTIPETSVPSDLFEQVQEKIERSGYASSCQ